MSEPESLTLRYSITQPSSASIAGALVDAQARIVRKCGAWASLLERCCDDLTCTDGRLLFAKASTERAVLRAIAAVLRGEKGGDHFVALTTEAPGILLKVTRSHDTPELALLVLIDLRAEWRAPVEALIASFGLTSAEARVVHELSLGLSIDEIADRLAVNAHTVRTHLKRTYAKVGVHRQHELVRIALTMQWLCSATDGDPSP